MVMMTAPQPLTLVSVRVTTCLVNLKLLGKLTAMREMSAKNLKRLEKTLFIATFTFETIAGLPSGFYCL